MAKRKKPRTPAPPRRPAAPRSSAGNGAQAQQPGPSRAVQAPQVRSGKKRTQADTDKRNRMILYGVAGAGIVGIVVVLLALFVLGKSSSTTAHFDGPNVDFANLPGLMRKPPPWPKNTKDLDGRAKQIDVQILPQEGVTLHIHQHLDIFVNGKHVTVPPLIGIKKKGERLRTGGAAHALHGRGHPSRVRAHTGLLARTVLRHLGAEPVEELHRQSLLAAQQLRDLRERQEDPGHGRSGQACPRAAR